MCAVCQEHLALPPAVGLCRVAGMWGGRPCLHCGPCSRAICWQSRSWHHAMATAPTPVVPQSLVTLEGDLCPPLLVLAPKWVCECQLATAATRAHARILVTWQMWVLSQTSQTKHPPMLGACPPPGVCGARHHATPCLTSYGQWCIQILRYKYCD